jgi:hypothetical protein
VKQGIPVTANYKFLARKNETAIINSQNKKIADLKVSDNSIMIGSKLQEIKGKSISEVDLSDLIKH